MVFYFTLVALAVFGVLFIERAYAASIRQEDLETANDGLRCAEARNKNLCVSIRELTDSRQDWQQRAERYRKERDELRASISRALDVLNPEETGQAGDMG